MDEAGDRVTVQPVQTADALVAVDDDVQRLVGHDHDRHLLPDVGERGQQPPLIYLDDALTRFDRKRLRLAFGLLAEVAAERQVVLFSEDEGVVDVARELGIKCAIIRLPGPAERTKTASEVATI